MQNKIGVFKLPQFTVTTSLKYKFVLNLLKEDGRNRSVSAYNDIIKFFNTMEFNA